MDYEILKLISIPVFSAIVGWITNVLALKMTFFPINFVGCCKPYLGWQGIIPSKAGRMAERAVDIMTKELISVHDVFERLDPDTVARILKPILDTTLTHIIDDVMQHRAPEMWESVPFNVKQEIYYEASLQTPKIVTDVMVDVKANILELFDLKKMVVEQLVRDRKLLNQIFLRVGEKEFRFIEQSGFIFGGFFGLLQMALWIFYEETWVLPVAGFFVGYLTNYIALKMIFSPILPRRVWGIYTWQGLFLKRQREVSEEYAALVSESILNSRSIISAIIQGPASDKLYIIINRHVARALDRFMGFVKMFVQFSIGTHEYINLKKDIVERIVADLPSCLRYLEHYADEAFAIQEQLRTKMGELPPQKFERMLHPVFEEDETKLILIGAFLGVCIGLFQAFVVHGLL